MQIEPYILDINFPKELMSITELVKLGFSRETLKNYSRVKDAPIIRTAGGGKILFITSRLNVFIQKYNKRVA